MHLVLTQRHQPLGKAETKGRGEEVRRSPEQLCHQLPFFQYLTLQR